MRAGWQLTAQPSNVLLLLLQVNVLRNEEGHLCVDASLLKESLQEHLEVLIKLAEWRSGVETSSCPVLLGCLGLGQLGGGEVVDVLDADLAILSQALDGEGTLALAGHGDLEANGEACRVVLLILQFRSVGRSDLILGSNANVTTSGVALVDGALGVGTSRLAIHIEGTVLITVKSGILGIGFFVVSVEVGDGEGNLDATDDQLAS